MAWRAAAAASLTSEIEPPFSSFGQPDSRDHEMATIDLARQRRVWAKLRGRFVHCTDWKGLIGIHRSGVIEPNRGQLETRLPRSATSIARHFGYISIFDFANIDESKAMATTTWVQYFPLDWLTIALEISPEWLGVGTRFVPYSRFGYLSYPELTRYGHVEAWVTEPIPWSALTGAWFIATPLKFKWVAAPLTLGRLRKFRRLLIARSCRIRTSPEEQQRAQMIKLIVEAGRCR